MITDYQRTLLKVAKTNGGSFLVDRVRAGHSQEWLACEALVKDGYLKPIPKDSHLAPGYLLTGKPVEVET